MDQDKRNKNGTRKKRAFTLIEILIVIAIISTLATVVLVRLSSGREQAKNKAVMNMMREVSGSAAACLLEKPGGAGGSQYMRINYPLNPANRSICQDMSSGAYLSSYSSWPYSGDENGNGTVDLVDKYDWRYYVWCAPGYSGASAPDSCGGYVNGTCGGNYSNGNFCFAVHDGENYGASGKFIWCTEKGCNKSGF